MVAGEGNLPGNPIKTWRVAMSKEDLQNDLKEITSRNESRRQENNNRFREDVEEDFEDFRKTKNRKSVVME